MFSYAAFNCELHADDTEVFWRMKLADCSQNRQPAKINFRPYGILLDPMQVRFPKSRLRPALMHSAGKRSGSWNYRFQVLQ